MILVAEGGQLETVKLLIGAGAEVNAANFKGATSLTRRSTREGFKET
jgi:ankyrin repeat protein